MRDEQQRSVSRRNLLTQFTTLCLSLPGLSVLAQGNKKPAPTKSVKWDDHFELAVDFEINQPEGFRYHRPYVAVWIENKEGKSIRTLSLWVSTTRRGPRWIPDLRRWYGNQQDNEKAGGANLISTLSSPTRMPGKYSLVWNGRDDKDKPVEQGTYTVCIESAREHGTYQLLRKEVKIAAKAFKADKAGTDDNVEFKGVDIEYRKRKPATP